MKRDIVIAKKLLYHALELLEAEKEGRLYLLSAKPGSTVYHVWCDDCGAGGGCIMYPSCQDCNDRRPKISEVPFNPSLENQIGKTVFLTHEEAEQALEKEKARLIDDE